MPAEDGLEALAFKHAGLDELEEASLVFGSSSLKRDGREVFGSKDAGGYAFDISLDSLRQSLLN